MSLLFLILDIGDLPHFSYQLTALPKDPCTLFQQNDWSLTEAHWLIDFPAANILPFFIYDYLLPSAFGTSRLAYFSGSQWFPPESVVNHSWNSNISVANDYSVYEGQCVIVRLLGRLEKISGSLSFKETRTVINVEPFQVSE